MFCEPHRVTFSIGEDFFAYQIDGIGKETNEQKEHVTDSLPTKRTGIFQDTCYLSSWLFFMWI